MERRKLQFFRSSTIYANRDTALANVEAFKATQLSGMSDGEIVLFRYTSKTGSIEAIIGCVINKNGNLDLSLVDVGELDIDNIEKSFSDIIAAVGLSGSTTGGEDGKSNIGYAPYVDNKYISGCTTMECAVNTLSDALEDEETARIESDNSLNDKIDTEIQDRIDADEELSGKIDTEIQDRINADEELGGKIDTEIQDRIDADEELDGVINNIINSVGLESGGTFSGFGDDTIVSGADNIVDAIETISDVIVENEKIVSSALTDLDARIKDVSGDVVSISSDLAEEITMREDADTALNESITGLSADLNNVSDIVDRIISGVGLSPDYGSFVPFEDNEMLSGAENVCDAISIVSETILDNELVVSSALNDLNSRILDMDLDTVSGSGQVIVSVSETDGKVSATLGNVDAADVTVSSTAFTGTTVQDALEELASATPAETGLTEEIAARKAVDGQTGQTYSANTGTTYISGASSLNDADIKLDTKVKELEDRIAELETALSEMDRVVSEALNDLNLRLLTEQGV